MGYGVWGMGYGISTAHPFWASDLFVRANRRTRTTRLWAVLEHSTRVRLGTNGGLGVGGVGWPITDTFTAHVSTQ